MYIFKIFNDFFKDYKFTIIFYLLFTILSFPLESIVIPQIYSNFFQVLNEKTKSNIFTKYILLILIVQIIVNFSNCITTYIEAYFIPELNSYIINYIFKYILIKYENEVTDLEIGKIITRISTIPSYMKEFISDFLVWVFPRALTVFIINIYFLYLNPILGIVSIILVILFIYFNLKYFLRCSNLSQDRHLLFEEKNQYTQDKLSNSSSIYSSGLLKNEIKQYNNDTLKYTSKFKENLLCLNNVNILSSILIIVLFISLNSISAYLFLKKKISFTNLMAIFITIIYYIPCIMTIIQTIPDLIHYYGSLKAVDLFIEDLYKVQISKKNEIEKPLIKINSGNIIINNLNFGYANDHYLFKNFYLTIKDNEKIAIIGPSGNGKSSLIKLIMGYYKIPNGQIFIDGKDINTFDLNDLRKQISYVNQNTKLFNLSIFDNIRYGNNTSNQDIINLCKKIKVENIFHNLKDGLNTIAGVEGGNLSGGQKQIVLLMRTMLKNNKIVILDEPTSAIDKENTDNVINAIQELGKNKTLIIITHDDTLLKLVNRVIKLKSGKIIDDTYI
jgi:ABC-type multidrug transport system fused ATPase/permease subunit